ncbi:cytosolic carboxypeptidase 2 isoform X2 [Girardinichthys multiradiatus]|uniref:cytosolic carboxypeptidase 2 isoform X2 n=1 Tax=Girardinichthys multiradiatus TaxID=208333 RepID=UPI001FAD0793|nr:cytosolic carboxypeptidase 2 isoform X2 [Girardinichthys multiradiatus]
MTEAVRPSGPAVPSIRSLWNAYKALDAGASNSEEDEDKLARRRQLWMNLSESLGTRQLLLNFQSGRPLLILRPPPDLVNFSRPRWPIECEVISDIIQHIEWEPPDPEPFYKPSEHELTPIPSGDERGKMVYCTDFAPKHLYFTCSCVGGSRDSTRSTTTLVKPSDVTLEFESRFESGNLQKAVQVGDYDYELTLRTDMYTEKHTQWFYFRVRNMKAGVTYRFTITNLMKRSSLYSQGMRPLLYSERAAKENRVGWQRAGSDIRYYRKCSQNIAEKNDGAISLYSLTWTLQFPYDSDTCYLAHCYPYTYSRLQRYLKQISSNPAVASYCKVWILCQSLAGNAVYVITITSRGTNQGDVRNRKAVVVTARVHPGETNGSWMMEGFLDFLLGDSDDAKVLRDNFIFKVVPMLNPDGVVVGNYRCSLTGRDLNRNYKTLLKDSFPCVWHTRNMVERLMAETEVVVYCDFHGHSRKNNVFMYGCNSRGDASIKLQERVFPLMMSKNASNKFSFKSCKFRVQKSKEGTGRIVMWRLGVKNSYTMEATFGGSTLDDRGGTHFTTGDLKSMGFYFCDTLLDFCDPDQTKVQYCLTEVSALLRKEIKRKMSKNLVTDGNFSLSDLETSTSGSNSSDSDGHPVHLLHQQKGPEKTSFKKKKKKLRSRRERNRFQLERVRSNTEAKVLESSTNTIDSSLSHKSINGERNREILVGERRRKWQLNGLMGKSGISTPTTHAGEEDSQETLCTSCMHHKLKHPYPSTCASMSLPSEERRQVKCSSHLLTLRAPPPHLPNLVQCKHYCYPPSLSSYQGCSGLSSFFMAPSSARFPSSAFVSMFPAIAPTSPTSRSRSRQCFRNRNLLLFSNHFSTKGFSTSVTDVTKTTQRSMDQKASSEADVTLFRTHGQNQKAHTTMMPP